MKKSIIKTLKVGSVKTGKYGDYYPTFVEFENGDKGNIFLKSADELEVGKEMEYLFDPNTGKVTKPRNWGEAGAFKKFTPPKSNAVFALEFATKIIASDVKHFDLNNIGEKTITLADTFYRFLEGKK